MFDRRHLQLLSYASICALLQFFAPTLAHSRDRNGAAGAVYTMSNDTSSNALLTFERNATGELTAKGVIPTGGRGTGAGLGNQGALALSDDGRWLVVVNAGSDDITLFDLKTGRPEPTARAASGGTRPISVSIEDDLVYVLNAGSDSIAGFRLNDHGRLEAVANSVRPLSGTGVGAAEIGIQPRRQERRRHGKGDEQTDCLCARRRGKTGAQPQHRALIWTDPVRLLLFWTWDATGGRSGRRRFGSELGFFLSRRTARSADAAPGICSDAPDCGLLGDRHARRPLRLHRKYAERDDHRIRYRTARLALAPLQ